MSDNLNILYMFDEVTEENCANLVSEIVAINKDETNEDPIHLYLTTPGGDAMAAMGLCDIIVSSKNPVYTYAIGKSYSAGFFLLLAGHKKYATKNTQVMLHDISYEVSGTPMEIAAENASSLVASDMIMDFVKERSNLTDEYINKVQVERKDLYFVGNDLLELGIIDEFVTEIT